MKLKLNTWENRIDRKYQVSEVYCSLTLVSPAALLSIEG